jgi:hypothetical protein
MFKVQKFNVSPRTTANRSRLCGDDFAAFPSVDRRAVHAGRLRATLAAFGGFKSSTVDRRSWGYFLRFFSRVFSSLIDIVGSFRLSSMSFQNFDEA